MGNILKSDFYKPEYDIKEINLVNYTNETKKIILSNLKNYTKLKKFYCNSCGLTELPELPNSLKYLYCSNNYLTELPNLPNLLTELFCFNNNLKELPDLPNSLTHLYCDNNELTELPNLPNSLQILDCHHNNLTELPKLPCSLTRLICNNNNLTELPKLPNTLTDLNCSNNNLTELPDLPDSLVCFRFMYDVFKLNYPIINFEDYEYNEYYILRVKIINETNLKNRIIKRIKLLNRNLLLEWSARICMNPKRIQRLLNANEIDFFDGSFDTLTY